MTELLKQISDLAMGEHVELPPSDTLITKYLTTKAVETIVWGRKELDEILSGKSKRFAIILGGCSVSVPKETLVYAEWLKEQQAKHSNLLLISRACCEKPRTSPMDWAGLVNQPYLDSDTNLTVGLQWSVELLCKINDHGVPVGAEILDTNLANYFAPLLSFGWFGARTNSIPHKRLALGGGLSPVMGVKNGLSGNIDETAGSLSYMREARPVTVVAGNGKLAQFDTKGAGNGRRPVLILRGMFINGKHMPNYREEEVEEAINVLDQSEAKGSNIFVDCSHSNSKKDHTRQPTVAQNVARQVKEGQGRVKGIMLETFINEGKQALSPIDELKKGVSVTDACLGRTDTASLLDELSEILK